MFWLRKIQRFFSKKSRAKKFKLFIEKMNPKESDSILNVGGLNFLSENYAFPKKIIILNINKKQLLDLSGKSARVLADACKLPFKDNSIEIAFSNAVIEHVGSWERQKLFASELRRVAKKYFVATPNKNFFFELHYHLPFFHFLPLRIRSFLTKNFSIAGYPKGYRLELDLLDKGSMQALFPEAKIVMQRTTIFPEIIIAYSKG